VGLFYTPGPTWGRLQTTEMRQDDRRTGVRSRVSFEVKSVVEALAARRAQIAFDVVMTTLMTLQQSL